MKIQGGNHPINTDPRVAGVKKAADQSAKVISQGDAATKVTLSHSASTLNSLKDDLSNVPEVRAEKVQALRSEIEKGSYVRPADQIAEKLINASLVETAYRD